MPTSKKHSIIALDVGGTKIAAGLISPSGKILKKTVMPTESSKGKNAVLGNIHNAIATVLQQDASAIGISMAALVDWKQGRATQSTNLPKDFKNVALAALLKKRFKMPVTLDNDVHCFTLAEAKFGAAKRFSSVVGITLGTGIGGGIVMDGRLIRGRNNTAGEFGHIMVDSASKALCGCGKTGHFEALASGSSMSRLYKDLTGKDLAPVKVEELAKKGDNIAKKVLAIMADGLANGISSVIYAINPDIVVVGGGLAKVDILWKPAMQQLKSTFHYPVLQTTPVVRSVLGSDANLLGAAIITQKL